MDALREKYPVSDWQYEVANGDTILGYEEWLMHCKERDESDHSRHEYECTVSCTYIAANPCAAACAFLADLRTPNDGWCISVRNPENDRHYVVSLPSGNVEESGEKWPGEHKGISAMAGDNYTAERHKEIIDTALELLAEGKDSELVNEQLRDAYGYSQKEIMSAAISHIRQAIRK